MQTFERPYGWAWLLKLAEELHGWDDADGKAWAKHIKPLADTIAARYISYFPKQTYPIRSGVHSSTAFGLTFALDYARTVGDDKLRDAIIDRARTYFAGDTDIPARWEPDGDDFFSPSLVEADLIRRVLSSDEFAAWFAKFLPSLARGEPKSLLEPATVADRTDPHIVHLDGLNLSRAWCMRGIAAALKRQRRGRRQEDLLPVRRRRRRARREIYAGSERTGPPECHAVDGDRLADLPLGRAATHALGVTAREVDARMALPGLRLLRRRRRILMQGFGRNGQSMKEF